ncbi:MAG: flagellar hook protein, partial [Lachnospiraceae bacterium]|nr:flagellar hook protein [Lachnospiraceae bacterium]
ALSDRQTIQDEVDQLLTEIDRVSETTKFNETYLLKGDKDTKTVTVDAHDAGIEGSLTQNTTKATFTMDKLSLGDTIKIGGTEYTIGASKADVIASIANLSSGELITIDGTQYTVSATADKNEDKNILDQAGIEAKIAEGSSVVYKGNTLKVMTTDATGAGFTGATQTASQVDYQDPKVISAKKAYDLIQQELGLASSVGATNTSATVTAGKAVTVGTAEKVQFEIKKGTVDRKEGLTFALHVGADADMTNKISVQIDALDTAGLGIKGLNVKDSSGAAATYAIDAIADAVSHVSSQRSLLGAVQNRLEHTINNLDNVVENTTAAESQIRDTDMATEMVKYSNANILSQAGQSMLAQGNQSNQGVLSLIG